MCHFLRVRRSRRRGAVGVTLYDDLGVTPGATDAVIRAAYKARMRETHPDAGGDPAQAQAVNTAYATLSDPDQRAAYDAKLEADRRATEATAAAPKMSAEAARRKAAESVESASIDIHKARPWHKELPLAVPAAAWSVLAIVSTLTTGIEEHGAITVASGALLALLAWRNYVYAFLALAGTVAALVYFEADVIHYALASAALLGGLGIVIIRHNVEADRALTAVDLFYAACLTPGYSGWFVGSANQVAGNVTEVLLTDFEDPSRQTSTRVWGKVTPGQYIAIDISQVPAPPKHVVTGAEAKMAAGIRRKQRKA